MPQKKSEFIRWFEEVGKNDVALVGGKGANLGEMAQAKFPVPNGFVVTSTTYFHFIEETGLKQKIAKVLENLDVNDSKALTTAAGNCRKLIMSASPSPEIKEAIIAAYQKLSEGKPALVAVRSSATAEDLPEASFAGQQESYMNIKGKESVLKTIQIAWSSLFEDRAVFYRAQKGFDHLKVGIAIPVQLMVHSEASGVMFTADPISNDTGVISIEGGYGFGDAIVSGSITPDQYMVKKSPLEITSKHIVDQPKMLAKGTTIPKNAEKFRPESELFWVDVPKDYREKQKISDGLILKLAEVGSNIEKHYNHPQDIEWAIEKNRVYVVQTRPITTLTVQDDVKPTTTVASVPQSSAAPTLNQPVLLQGLGASPGIATGPVCIIKDSTEIDKVKKGDILVTGMTTPDFVPAMRKAVAVVTNLGGRTSHAAIVSRELGIPAVVGTDLATKTLKKGEIITVDGKQGKIYSGKVDLSTGQAAGAIVAPNLQEMLKKTATKIYCNLGEPQLAEDIAKRNVDGVGLLRAEFMIANIGQHPRYMLEKGRRDEFVDELFDGIMKFAKAFDPRPVIYRATDFRTNEYRGLKGGEKYESEEENPMIGFRGVSRYLADPEVFKMELEAIKRVRRYHQNIWVMLPFVRTPEELREAKKIMATMGLYRTGTFKLLIMVEVPSTVLMLERFIGVGIDGVSIGSNDLTQLILGVDRDNAKIANIFNEQNPAVMWALEHIIKVCQAHGITSGICGQAPSEYPELVTKLVEWGASSISVSPDVIEQTRDLVAQAEFEKVRMRKFSA